MNEIYLLPATLIFIAAIISTAACFVCCSASRKEPSYCAICRHWHRGKERSKEPFPDHSGAAKVYRDCAECAK